MATLFSGAGLTIALALFIMLSRRRRPPPARPEAHDVSATDALRRRRLGWPRFPALPPVRRSFPVPMPWAHAFRCRARKNGGGHE
jgi:hypothetical protein